MGPRKFWPFKKNCHFGPLSKKFFQIFHPVLPIENWFFFREKIAFGPRNDFPTSKSKIFHDFPKKNFGRFFEKNFFFPKKRPKKNFFFDFFKFWSRKKIFYFSISGSIIAYGDPNDSPQTELIFFYNFFFYALLKNGHFWPFLAIFRNFGLLGVWTRGNCPEYDHMGLRIYSRV